MDIWEWVHERSQTLYDEGQRDFAIMIEEISHYAVNDDLQRVDQIYNQALPICRSMGDKWLEIYFRHWRLQAHVLKNYDAKGLLPECISLLDFSHAPDTKGCPQRICAVQDLAACYGIKDGPGYAEERIQVCKETLAEIDGSWPCYQCVGSELLDAYMDAGRYEEVDAELKEMDLELRRNNETLDTEFQLTQAEYYLKTGKLDKAWSVIKDAVNPGGGSGFIRSRDLSKALVLCAQEKWEEALKVCPSYEDILIASTYFGDWSEIQAKLAQAGKIKNDRQLRYRIHNLAQKLVEKGAYRIAFEVYQDLAGLCLAANETVRTKAALNAMIKVQSELNRDMGATDTITSLRRRLEGLPPSSGPKRFDTSDSLLDHEFLSETEEILAIDAGLTDWPGDANLIQRKVGLLEDLFLEGEAYQLLEASYANNPDVSAFEFEFGRAYLRKHGYPAYQKAFPMEGLEGLEKAKIWNRGFLHFRELERHDPEAALRVLEAIEPYWPDDLYLFTQLANLLITLGRYEEALSYRVRQVEIDPDNPSLKWDLLIAATLAGASDKISQIGRELGMTVQDDGVFPEDKQPSVRIETKAAHGDMISLAARRIGPVLARVTTVSDLDDPVQFFGQEIVFDPSPLNTLDQEDEDGYPCDKDGFYTYHYPSVSVLSEPLHGTFAIDGVSPGEEALDELREEIEAAGFVYNRRSNEHYRLFWEKDGEDGSGTGIYIYVIAPESADLNRLNTILSAFNERAEHPLIWPRLSEALGDEEMLRRQVEIAELYGLED